MTRSAVKKTHEEERRQRTGGDDAPPEAIFPRLGAWSSFGMHLELLQQGILKPLLYKGIYLHNVLVPVSERSPTLTPTLLKSARST